MTSTLTLLDQLELAAKCVYQYMPPTPQYHWPLLSERLGCEVWVKHENMTPLGAFKVRGGLVYLNSLRKNHPEIKGVIAASRGNHGQSIGYAAKKMGLHATIVVPKGNSSDKNRAMRALGVNVIEEGNDFQESMDIAAEKAQRENLHMVPSFAPELVEGVASYGLELFSQCPDLDTVYVSIGLGSGICGTMMARDALNCPTKIVGVVAEKAPAYALSFKQKLAVSTDTANTLADGLACRIPNAEALDLVLQGVENVTTVSEQNILEAIGIYFTDCHQIAEGAGAAPLAGLIQNKTHHVGQKVGVVLSGGNIDTALFQQALQTIN